MKDAATSAQRYLQGMQSPNAADNYKKGVQGVTQSPTALAATPEAMQNYINGVQNSVTSGKRASALQAVTLQQWQAAAAGKGAQRLSSGAAAAMPKVQAHFQKWTPIYEQAKQAAKALPKGGFANAAARQQAAMLVLMQAAGTA